MQIANPTRASTERLRWMLRTSRCSEGVHMLTSRIVDPARGRRDGATTPGPFSICAHAHSLSNSGTTTTTPVESTTYEHTPPISRRPGRQTSPRAPISRLSPARSCALSPARTMLAFPRFSYECHDQRAHGEHRASPARQRISPRTSPRIRSPSRALNRHHAPHRPTESPTVVK